MKTKQFMAQRIFEQQDEIENLKNQLFYQSIKHVQMYEWLKFVNEQLLQIKQKKESENQKKEDLNISDELASSFVYEEKHEKIDTEFEKKKNIAKHPSTSSLREKELEFENLNKIIHNLKSENIDLKKENEMVKIENLEKNLLISKLRSEKFILFNELNELTNSLRAVDLKLLNKFYKNFTSSLKLNKSFMPSSLGIKYNILSVQNQLSYLMHSDLVAAKSFSEYSSKAKDTFAKEKAKMGLNLDDDLNTNDYNNENDNFIDLDKYLNVVKKFEKEFDSICDKNYKRDDYWRNDE